MPAPIVINGTNGNDLLIGKKTDEVFNPLLGVDVAFGGGGIDTLNVDYSSVALGGGGLITTAGAAFSGYLGTGGSTNLVAFGGMSVINYTGTSGDDGLVVDASALVNAGTALNLDAGAGADRLDLDISNIGAGTLDLSGATSTSTFANLSISNFERYWLHVGTDQTVTAGAGADYFFTDNSAGGNTLYGGGGNDTFFGSATGSSTFDGQGGTDTVRYDNATSDVTINLRGRAASKNDGADLDTFFSIENAFGSAQNDTISGTEGANYLNGQAGEDLIFGRSGDDVILGGAGNDWIDGGAGSDTIYGGDGDDELTGVGGADKLYGGAGADIFRYTDASDSTVASSGRDRIFDFSSAEGDKISLSLFGPTSFSSDGRFHNVIGEIISNPLAGVPGDYLVQADLNGDARADFSLRVTSAAALTASDFI